MWIFHMIEIVLLLAIIDGLCDLDKILGIKSR